MEEREPNEWELKLMEQDLKAKEEGARIVRELDNAVNRMDDNPFADGFVEQLTCRTHRTLQQNIAGLFLKCFEAWAKLGDEGCFDLRNEGTVKLAQKIREAAKDSCLPFV